MHVSLQKLLSKDPEASSLIETLLVALGSSMSVYDTDGNLLDTLPLSVDGFDHALGSGANRWSHRSVLL